MTDQELNRAVASRIGWTQCAPPRRESCLCGIMDMMHPGGQRQTKQVPNYATSRDAFFRDCLPMLDEKQIGKLWLELANLYLAKEGRYFVGWELTVTPEQLCRAFLKATEL